MQYANFILCMGDLLFFCGVIKKDFDLVNLKQIQCNLLFIVYSVVCSLNDF